MLDDHVGFCKPPGTAASAPANCRATSHLLHCPRSCNATPLIVSVTAPTSLASVTGTPVHSVFVEPPPSRVVDVNAIPTHARSTTDHTATLGVGVIGDVAVAAKVSCTVPTSDRGAWGIAAAGANARVDVAAVTVARSR